MKVMPLLRIEPETEKLVKVRSSQVGQTHLAE